MLLMVQKNWLVTKDYNGNIDLGAKINLDGGQIFVNGSSESSPNDWDIVTWQYDDGGNFQNEQRNSGTSTSSDQLKDGALESGYMVLTGSSYISNSNDFKVVCLDASNNFLWSDTFNKGNLADEGTAIAISASSFVAAGYVTTAANNEDILVRKYDLGGTLLWSREIDFDGKNDRAIDIVEDGEGNFLVLADVTDGAQKDVYIYSLSGSTGSVSWSEQVSDDAGLDETGISLEVAFGGEVYVTYQVNNLSVTEAYSYGEMDFPTDDEPFSRGNLYISNSGQLKDENGQSVMNVRYFSFGSYPDYFMGDNFFSLVSFDSTQSQRIDFEFLDANATHVGHLEEYEKETRLNYYTDFLKYENQGTFDVLAWPGIYEGTDAYVSSNSEGFKLTFVLDEGSDLAEIELDIKGSSNLSLNGGNLHVETVHGDIVYLAPFSYEQGSSEIFDDNCIVYTLDDGKLKFQYICMSDFSYPYVIQVKVGAGQVYSSSAIGNMDWSTFFGGNGSEKDHGALEVDQNNGDLYMGCIAYSTAFPQSFGITNGSFGTFSSPNGLLSKFDIDGAPIWLTLMTGALPVVGIGLHENLSAWTGKEIHVVGRVSGSHNLNFIDPSIPQGAYQQIKNNTNTSGGSSESYLASFKNLNGTLLYRSNFGSKEIIWMESMSISNNGLMYFCGSTQGGSTAQIGNGSPDSPSGWTFPVYNPGDGSVYTGVHPSQGISYRGFLTVLNLSTYKLAYSSLLNDYQHVNDIKATGSTSAICGEGFSGGRLGFFNSSSKIYDPTGTNHSVISRFTSISPAFNGGNAFIGINTGGLKSLQTSPVSPQYKELLGEAYIVRYVGTTPVWDSYFGKNSDQASGYWGLSSMILGGLGQLAYNNTTSTLFAGAQAKGLPIEIQSKQNFFTQATNSSNGSNSGSDLYLAAFTGSTTPGATDVLTWSTMYGGDGTAGEREEAIYDIVTYDFGGDSYVVTLGHSTTPNGSTSISDIDYYPVTNFISGTSWYKPNNTLIGRSYADMVITRFNITDVNQGVSLVEVDPSQDGFIEVFPSPANLKLNIVSGSDKITQIEIFDLSGKQVEKYTFPDGDGHIEIDVSVLMSGVYIIKANEKFIRKFIKM